jgi:hypothetical protein
VAAIVPFASVSDTVPDSDTLFSVPVAVATTFTVEPSATASNATEALDAAFAGATLIVCAVARLRKPAVVVAARLVTAACWPICQICCAAAPNLVASTAAADAAAVLLILMISTFEIVPTKAPLKSVPGFAASSLTSMFSVSIPLPPSIVSTDCSVVVSLPFMLLNAKALMVSLNEVPTIVSRP